MQRFGMKWCGVACFGIMTLATAVSADASYIDAVAADHPTGYWRFDETSGATAANQVSGGAAGTYTGTYTLGAEGALTLSGGHDLAYSSVGASDSSQTWSTVGGCVALGSSVFPSIDSTHDFTIEMWFRPSQTSLRGDLLNCKKGQWPQSSYNDFGLIAEDGKVSVFHQVSSDESKSKSASITANAWYNAVITRASGAVTFYLNNQVVDTFADACSLTDTSVRVGANNQGSGGVYNSYGAAFSGTIDEFAVYDHAISADRVSAHFAAAVPEPNTLILFASGVVGLLAYAWRKRK